MALGLVYTAIEVLTLFGSPLFYKIVVIAEIVLTSMIVFYALRWPRVSARSAPCSGARRIRTTLLISGAPLWTPEGGNFGGT